MFVMFCNDEIYNSDELTTICNYKDLCNITGKGQSDKGTSEGIPDGISKGIEVINIHALGGIDLHVVSYMPV